MCIGVISSDEEPCTWNDIAYAKSFDDKEIKEKCSYMTNDF